MNMLHTMLRVGDLQRSIDFYTNVIGMELLRKTERPEQKYSLAFVAFGGGNKNGEAEIELTYNHGTSEYDLGDAYGHIALGVDSVAGTKTLTTIMGNMCCSKMRANNTLPLLTLSTSPKISASTSLV